MNSISFRRDIQGLRAIAVIAVVLFHYNSDWLPGGYIGVDVFLVVSGFLITSILLSEKKKANYNFFITLKCFYVSRVKRIAPAYFVMLVFVALVTAVLFLTHDFKAFQISFENAIWFNSNNYFSGFGDYFSTSIYEQPLLHTWSLAVEIQFYLLAPFLVLFLSVRCLKLVFAILLIGLTTAAEYRLRVLGMEQSTYYSLLARLPEFYAGGLTALYLATGSKTNNAPLLNSLGLLLILFAAVSQPVIGVFPGVAVFLPVLGCVLIISHPSKKGLGSILLANSILVWIGAISYSIYLWHWPVLALLRYVTGMDVLSFNYSIVFLALTMSLSLISYYFVERTFRTNRTDKKQTILWIVLATSVFASSPVLARTNSFFSTQELPVEYRRYADQASICHGQIVGECIRGDVNSSVELLVLGDSHAAMLNHFFDYLGTELGFKARIITASNCVTIEGFDVNYIAEWAREDCIQQIEAAKRFIDGSNSIALAGMWTYQLKSEINVEAIAQFLDVFQNKNIVLFKQVPELNMEPSKYSRFRNIGLNVTQGVTKEWLEYGNLLERIIEQCENCMLIESDPFHSNNQLPFGSNGLLYFDESHLNEIGAIAYAEAMKEQVRVWLFEE